MPDLQVLDPLKSKHNFIAQNCQNIIIHYKRIKNLIYYFRMGNKCCNTKTRKKKNWDLLSIVEQPLEDTCPTSEKLDDLAIILRDLFVELNGLNSKKSKNKVADLFDEKLCEQIKYQYFNRDEYLIKDEKEMLNFNKLLKMYKEKYDLQNVTQEEESRIFHNLASNILELQERYFAKTQKKEEFIDELVYLECFQCIVERSVEKFKYEIEQLREDTERMNQMLKQTIKQFRKQLNSLKYDLEDSSDYFLAAEISKYACQYHENGIYFLIFYFKRCFDKLEKKGKKVKSIEEITKKVLDQFQSKYKPGEKLQNIQEYTEYFDPLELKNQNVEYNTYQLNKTDRFSQLQEIIIQQAKRAEGLKYLFDTLITECCLKNSLWSKTNLKINPYNPNQKSMIRIFEKLLFKNKLKKKNQAYKNLPSQTIKKQIKQQGQQLKNKIFSALEGKKAIQFIISDMLRGKCIFQVIEDILVTIASIKQFVSNNQTYEIIEIENRFKLQNPISDFTLKIQIEDIFGNRVIAQLQLSLQKNFAIYNFAHRIYQFVRSEIFSKIKTLMNYFEEYEAQMTEMIIGQLQNSNNFSKQERKSILSYFFISNKSQNRLSLSQSFYKRIETNEDGEKKEFENFLERSKSVQPLINMILFRALNMIDNKKVEIARNQMNIAVKDMMMLQILKYWDPFTNREKKHELIENYSMFKQSKSLRNHILNERFNSQNKEREIRHQIKKKLEISYRMFPDKQQFSDIPSMIYGYFSPQNAQYLFQRAKYTQATHLENTQEDYIEALDCFSKLDQRELNLELECQFRYFALKFKLGEVQQKMLKQLLSLSVQMKQSKRFSNALAIELLISQYYLIYEKNDKLFKTNYKTAEEMSKIQGIPFVGQVINDIELRIWRYRFFNSVTQSVKQQIFTKKLRHIIQSLGTYKGYFQIFKLLNGQFIEEILALEIQLPHFRPNRFQTKLDLFHLTKFESRVLMKMHFQNLEEIQIIESKIKGDKLCDIVVSWKCPHIKNVNLKNNQITDKGVRILSKANWPKLSLLLIGCNHISDVVKADKILKQAFPWAKQIQVYF